MCGVVGVAAREAMVTDGELHAGLGALHHRGPDGRGVFVDEGRTAGLGHARLSIVDLETGAQPIANEDGSLVIVVNGELYDFERTRADLEARGHRFRTRSDSEIALHLYEEHGDAFVEHLRGEFAVLLWDARKRRLIAVRDRFGIKPLVWTQHRGRVLLASEAKALFAMGVVARWDERSFTHVATHQYLPPSRTMFEGISAVPPGHFLAIDRGTPSLHRYWDIDAPITVSAEPSAEELRSMLDECVRLRLRADVPVGFYLSGGLDSASIVALAAPHVSGPLRTFGVRFFADGYDESSLAEDVASHVGARHETVDVRQEDLVEALPDAVWFSEGLAINGQLTAKLALSRAVQRAGLKVVLTGEGADEALLGYPHLVRDVLRTRDDDDGARWLARLEGDSHMSSGVMMPDATPPALDVVRRTLGFVPSWIEAKALLGSRVRELLSVDVERSVDPEAVWADLFSELDVAGQLEGRPPVVQSSWLWTKLALAGYILRTLGDGTEMASSVEGRTPFLDHRFFELANRISVERRVHRGVEKHVLREVMRPSLPEHIVNRRKHPFLAPPITRFGGERVWELVQDVLRSDSFASVPFFDRDRVIALLDRIPQLGECELAAAEPPLMLALTAAILHRRFGLGGPS